MFSPCKNRGRKLKCGCGGTADALVSGSSVERRVGSNPVIRTKKYCRKGYIFCSIFLSIAKAMAYHRRRRISSPKVYIINRRLYLFRNDDIQHSVLVIYSSEKRYTRPKRDILVQNEICSFWTDHIRRQALIF